MKNFAIASSLIFSTLILSDNVPVAFGEKLDLANKNVQEDKLYEIISCGYAFIHFSDVDGSDYLCYGEVDKLNFFEKTNCRKVRAEFDAYTKRPSKIIYINSKQK